MKSLAASWRRDENCKIRQISVICSYNCSFDYWTALSFKVRHTHTIHTIHTPTHTHTHIQYTNQHIHIHTYTHTHTIYTYTHKIHPHTQYSRTHNTQTQQASTETWLPRTNGCSYIPWALTSCCVASHKADKLGARLPTHCMAHPQEMLCTCNANQLEITWGGVSYSSLCCILTELTNFVIIFYSK